MVKTYSNAAGEFAALKGINLQMNYGQFISIVGKSGSGKSTLLNMITGIDHPTSGQILVGGEDIYKLSESKRALWRGRSIGIVFQFFQLLPTLTLLENTMLPMDYCNIYPSAERPGRAMELLKMVGLEDQAYKLPAAVSSGQQQSAAIARALATDPPIILADEPTGNLDSRSAERILTLFSQLSDQGKSILIVTHDTSFTRRTDQTVILSDGEIIDEALAQALPLLNHPQMLQATRQAQSRIYSPGEVIVCQGDRIDHFFAIAQGEVDVVVKNQDCPEVLLAPLGQGAVFRRSGADAQRAFDRQRARLAGLPGRIAAAAQRGIFTAVQRFTRHAGSGRSGGSEAPGREPGSEWRLRIGCSSHFTPCCDPYCFLKCHPERSEALTAALIASDRIVS